MSKNEKKTSPREYKTLTAREWVWKKRQVPKEVIWNFFSGGKWDKSQKCLNTKKRQVPESIRLSLPENEFEKKDKCQKKSSETSLVGEKKTSPRTAEATAAIWRQSKKMNKSREIQNLTILHEFDLQSTATPCWKYRFSSDHRSQAA